MVHTQISKKPKMAKQGVPYSWKYEMCWNEVKGVVINPESKMLESGKVNFSL